MKNILCTCAVSFMLFISCSKTDTELATVSPASQTVGTTGKAKPKMNGFRISGPCNFQELIQQPNGDWETVFEGTTIRFRNIHDYYGKLYGDLVYTENATIQDGENSSRTFAFQRVGCVTEPLTITKTESETDLMTYSIYSDNSTFLWDTYNNGNSSATSLVAANIKNFVAGVKYGVNKAKTIHFDVSGATINCQSTYLAIGKLAYIKDPATNTFKIGVAGLCYEDPQVPTGPISEE